MSRKILSIEDNEHDQMIIKRAITRAHLGDISFASDGEQGIRQVRASRPDLILLDVHLPKMNGFDVCRTLKKNSKTKSVPIFLFTSLEKVTDVIQGLEAGADNFISKSSKPGQLVDRIRQLVGETKKKGRKPQDKSRLGAMSGELLVKNKCAQIVTLVVQTLNQVVNNGIFPMLPIHIISALLEHVRTPLLGSYPFLSQLKFAPPHPLDEVVTKRILWIEEEPEFSDVTTEDLVKGFKIFISDFLDLLSRLVGPAITDLLEEEINRELLK
jgi:two-component system, OmpR family, alkaline phosphatase synthesis response regulator PhoP